MSQTQRLLLLAPPTQERTAAFVRAEALAVAMQMPLHIVAFGHVEALSVAGWFAPDQVQQARDGYLLKHRQWLEEHVRQLIGKGLEATCEVVWVERPYEEILNYVKELPVAMIIKDAHEESALKRVFFTPLDWQLLRDCPVPVHLVTEARHPLPRQVLAIVDVLRSEELELRLNDRILDAAAKLAQQCNARLQLLHVYDWSAVYASDMGFGALPVAADYGAAMGKLEREAFAKLAERHGVPPECRHFIEGIPLITICTFAIEHKVDVIVMGTVQHGGLNKLLGTTAEHLLHRAPCSVLAVKPGDLEPLS